MAGIHRVTEPTVDVLRILLDSRDPVWGLKIVDATGRKAGSIYPILGRLEEAGWISGEWESDDARTGARRRLYRLTATGATEAPQVVATFDARTARPALGTA